MQASITVKKVISIFGFIAGIVFFIAYESGLFEGYATPSEGEENEVFTFDRNAVWIDSGSKMIDLYERNNRISTNYESSDAGEENLRNSNLLREEKWKLFASSKLITVFKPVGRSKAVFQNTWVPSTKVGKLRIPGKRIIDEIKPMVHSSKSYQIFTPEKHSPFPVIASEPPEKFFRPAPGSRK